MSAVNRGQETLGFGRGERWIPGFGATTLVQAQDGSNSSVSPVNHLDSYDWLDVPPASWLLKEIVEGDRNRLSENKGLHVGHLMESSSALNFGQSSSSNESCWLPYPSSASSPLQQDEENDRGSTGSPAINLPASDCNNVGTRYKTELCRPFLELGECKYGSKCQFAHGTEELKNLNRHPRYRTELCRRFHSTGFCSYGTRCHFLHIHNEEQLTAQLAAEKLQRQAGGLPIIKSQLCGTSKLPDPDLGVGVSNLCSSIPVSDCTAGVLDSYIFGDKLDNLTSHSLVIPPHTASATNHHQEKTFADIVGEAITLGSGHNGFAGKLTGPNHSTSSDNAHDKQAQLAKIINLCAQIKHLSVHALK